MKKQNLQIDIDLIKSNKLNSDELIILAFIIKQIEENKHFYLTNNEIVEYFNHVFHFHKIVRILSSLHKKNFIERLTYNSTGREIKLVGDLKPSDEVILPTKYQDIVEVEKIEEKLNKSENGELKLSNDFHKLINEVD